jgi:hypothetical protein
LDVTEKILRREAKILPPGKDKLTAFNGAEFTDVAHLGQIVDAEAKKIIMPGVPELNDGEAYLYLQEGAQNIIDKISDMALDLEHIGSIREQCVRHVAKDAGFPLKDASAVEFFRHYSALTPRAFMLALLVEALHVAQELRNPDSPHRGQLLNMVGRNMTSQRLPSTTPSLAAAVQFLPKADGESRISVTKLLHFLPAAVATDEMVMKEFSGGDIHKDRALAQVFLDHIYHYSGWENKVSPGVSHEAYREHQWRELYTRFGLFGHIFL